MEPLDIFQVVRLEEIDTVRARLTATDVLKTVEGKRTLLHVAIAYRRSIDIIEEIIVHGSDVNATDSNGETPLHYAAVHGSADVAKLLLERGAVVSISDKNGNTPLWAAVFTARGKYEVVEVLLKHGGFNVAATKNKHGKSPRDFAQQIGDARLLELLNHSAN